MKKNKIIFDFVFLIFWVTFVTSMAYAKEPTLIWDPNPPEQKIIGYTVWYAYEPRPQNITHPDQQDGWHYPFRKTILSGTAYQLPEIPSRDIYLSVTAFTADYISGFSKELHYAVQGD